MIKKTLSGELVAEFGLCKDRHEYRKRQIKPRLTNRTI